LATSRPCTSSIRFPGSWGSASRVLSRLLARLLVTLVIFAVLLAGAAALGLLK
jgi:hypothetical protein